MSLLKVVRATPSCFPVSTEGEPSDATVTGKSQIEVGAHDVSLMILVPSELRLSKMIHRVISDATTLTIRIRDVPDLKNGRRFF